MRWSIRLPSWRRWPPARALARIPWLQQPARLAARSVREFADDHCQQLAAAISFHVLFSLFPLAIAAVGVVGLVTQDNQARTAVADAVLRVIPFNDQGKRNLDQVLTSLGGTAGALGLLGLLGVLWSASGMMAAIRTALNVAWDTDVKRPFVRGKAVDLALIGGTFLATGAALGVTILAGLVRHGSQRLPGLLAQLTGVTITVGAVVAATALLFVTFVFLYRFVPAVETRVRDVWPGALVSAVGFEAIQYGFSVYLSQFAHYNKVYGTLGGIVAFLFFVYLASAVFLFGAEVAAEYPRLRAGLPPGVPRRAAQRPAGADAAPGQGQSKGADGDRPPGAASARPSAGEGWDGATDGSG